MHQPSDLEDSALRELEKLIRKSFRVRANMTPIYVDIGGNLARVALDQHQIVFGRRGSGKSTLLLYFRRKEAPKDSVHTIYLNADSVKTLEYPDVLIRVLLAIFENLPSRRLRSKLRHPIRGNKRTKYVIRELRDLLAQPVESKTRETAGSGVTDTRTRNLGLDAGKIEGARTRETARESRTELVREYDERKVQAIDNRLPDYKGVSITSLSGRRRVSGRLSLMTSISSRGAFSRMSSTTSIGSSVTQVCTSRLGRSSIGLTCSERGPSTWVSSRNRMWTRLISTRPSKISTRLVVT